MKIIPYGKQHIIEEDVEAVVNVLKSELLTQGPTIKAFEDSFAEYIGCKYAVAVSNGTAALHLSVMALGLEPKEKVITTAITFAASANCVKYAGGDVVFADIDPETFLLDLNDVERLLKKSPKGTYKGIIVVDFAGRAVNLEEFTNLATKYGCWLIEDACHAPGGFFIDSNNEPQNCGNGKYADTSVFSFHPVKHIAAGEGGMITTNDENIYRKLLNLRTHGIQQDPELKEENHGLWYYEMQELGYNYRLTDFQAALGLSQLQRAEAGMKRRKEIARIYSESFIGKEYVLRDNGLIPGHAYHLYVVEFSKRKELYEFLREKGIYTQVHYIPVHMMPYYKNLGWERGTLPNAEKYYENCLSLPMFPSLTNEELYYVISSIREFYGDSN